MVNLSSANLGFQYKSFLDIVGRAIMGDSKGVDAGGRIALLPGFDQTTKSLLEPCSTLEFWKTQLLQWAAIAERLRENYLTALDSIGKLTGGEQPVSL